VAKYFDLYERLVANSAPVEGQNENGCWQWTARQKGRNKPYGQLNVYVEGKLVTLAAHRAMENQFRDRPLSPGETLDHLCGNPLCINPDHWEVTSNEENARRSQLRNSRGFHTGHGTRYGGT
jgi:hypothetical protein